MRVDVSMKERVLVLIDGKPQKYLGPGRYRMLVAPWRKVEVKPLRKDLQRVGALIYASSRVLIRAQLANFGKTLRNAFAMMPFVRRFRRAGVSGSPLAWGSDHDYHENHID